MRDDDFPNYYTADSGWVKARKVHLCKSCGMEIAKGEKYWRVLVHPDTYQYYTLKFCAFCHAAFERKRQKVYV